MSKCIICIIYKYLSNASNASYDQSKVTQKEQNIKDNSIRTLTPTLHGEVG